MRFIQSLELIKLEFAVHVSSMYVCHEKLRILFFLLSRKIRMINQRKKEVHKMTLLRQKRNEYCVGLLQVDL